MVLLPGCRCCGSNTCFGDWTGVSSAPDFVEIDIEITNPSSPPQLTAKTKYLEEVREYYLTPWLPYSTTTITLLGSASGPTVSRQTISIPIVKELLQFGIMAGQHVFSTTSTGAPRYYININLGASGGVLGVNVEVVHAELTSSTTTATEYHPIDRPGFTPQPNTTSSSPTNATQTISIFRLACSAPSGIVSGWWTANTGFSRALLGAGGIAYEMFAYPRQCNGNPLGMRDYSVTVSAEDLFPVVIATQPAIYVSRFASDDWYVYFDTRARTDLDGSVQAGGFTELASPVGIGGATDASWYAIQSTVKIYGISLVRGTVATAVDGSRFLTLLPQHPAASCIPDWLSYS